MSVMWTYTLRRQREKNDQFIFDYAVMFMLLFCYYVRMFTQKTRWHNVLLTSLGQVHTGDKRLKRHTMWTLTYWSIRKLGSVCFLLPLGSCSVLCCFYAITSRCLHCQYNDRTSLLCISLCRYVKRLKDSEGLCPVSPSPTLCGPL